MASSIELYLMKQNRLLVGHFSCDGQKKTKIIKDTRFCHRRMQIHFPYFVEKFWFFKVFDHRNICYKKITASGRTATNKVFYFKFRTAFVSNTILSLTPYVFEPYRHELRVKPCSIET